MILYFSGSGNSRYVAKELGTLLNDEVVSLNSRIKNNDISVLFSDKPYVIVCPIYAWRIPKIVEEHLKATKLLGNNKVYLFITACGSSGNGDSYAKEFFTGMKMEYMGSHTFYMLGSYVAFMENPDLNKAEEVNKQVQISLLTLFKYIQNESKLPFQKVSIFGKFMSRFANPFFYKHIIGKDGFYITNKCIGCGKCVGVCPLNNIHMKNDNPVWDHKCTHCMACVHQCPRSAIEFKKITIKKNRYYNNG